MLKGKNVIVTGATRGIGKEIALTLAQNGANIAINYRLSTNDVWRIKRIQFLDNALINIFDRFGKLIISLNQDAIGWNGTYNGIALPSTDYWFTITLNNGKTIRGNFSLKR